MVYRNHSPIQVPIYGIAVIGIVNAANTDVPIFQNIGPVEAFRVPVIRQLKA